MTPTHATQRQRFPQDEKRQPWLSLLLEVQHLTNQGVVKAIHEDGRRLACGRGCAACCRSHADIPDAKLKAEALREMRWETLAARMAAPASPDEPKDHGHQPG